MSAPVWRRELTRTRPFVLGVAGGTGSGKTTVAERLAGELGTASLALLTLDAYYLDRPYQPSPPPSGERLAINYDHPDAFDWALLRNHLQNLVAGQAVPMPTYDFTCDGRGSEVVWVAPSTVVVVEGILVLYEPELRELFDLKVFVDTAATTVTPCR